ncbi:hypothetical protein HYPSUDRAFT_141856 [Hypholoma sublateritium FD-334 SS-4]|uniref:N-terminal nucleophile aminohydrolase n=1 Tax=Hypholoma sublateritium (strain FD-334 SS-4) TaxID=945553 RepID=A0A0D2PLF0_HYPSF|nr:hypothetical protein HYPSUDRAFT_141856 [Hypholoma sublateritium FD-334 SS-4]
MPLPGYIAVHGGAGAHGITHEKEVKRALRNTAPDGASNGGESALSMVEFAITVLENDGHLNAGYGSNLTVDGTVECDASITCAQGPGPLFGSAGAVSGVKNPIKLARAILNHARVPDPLGRVPPLTLVATGARKFAEGCVETVPDDALIAPAAREQWERWTRRLAASAQGAMDAGADEPGASGVRDVQDTVGAVALRRAGGMAAGVSSGGLLLKHPGRVGEAAVYGAGCWATDRMACSVSGTGEHIVRANLARKIGEALRSARDKGGEDPHDVLDSVLIEFWESCCEQGEVSPSVGVILLVDAGDDSAVRMWCAFTTPSMAVGYASTESPKPKAIIFRHPSPHGAGHTRPQIFITSLSL